MFADADLEAAAAGVTTESIFTGNAGQVCVAGSRILVQRSVLSEMLERMEAIASGIVLGDPLDPRTTMGPIVSEGQYDSVTNYLEVGKKEAELDFGGRHGADVVPEFPGGYWVEPTLFIANDNSLRICQEEIFGPVAVVIPFDTSAASGPAEIVNDRYFGKVPGDRLAVHRQAVCAGGAAVPNAGSAETPGPVASGLAYVTPTAHPNQYGHAPPARVVKAMDRSDNWYGSS